MAERQPGAVMNADRQQVAELATIAGLFAPPGRALYIGASLARNAGLRELLDAGHEVTLLEIWPINCWAYREAGDIPHVVCGDVRRIAWLALPYPRYDVALWLHGPEHIARDELAATLAALERRAALVVLGSPWGRYPQDAAHGNPHERHLAALYPADYETYGYTVRAIGAPDDPATGRLTAWKPTEGEI